MLPNLCNVQLSQKEDGAQVLPIHCWALSKVSGWSAEYVPPWKPSGDATQTHHQMWVLCGGALALRRLYMYRCVCNVKDVFQNGLKTVMQTKTVNKITVCGPLAETLL